MLGNYSKLIGSLLGGAVGWAFTHFGIHADPDTTAAVTGGISALATVLFPANSK
jgi:hypothetical protein